MSNLTDIVKKQILRGDILQICNATGKEGAGVKLIISALKSEGVTVTEEDVTDACNYLEGKGLIKMDTLDNRIRGVKWTISYITPKGIDVLEGTTAVEGVEIHAG